MTIFKSYLSILSNLLVAMLFIFTNSNLFCQDNTQPSIDWQYLISELNQLEDINETAIKTYKEAFIKKVADLNMPPSRIQIQNIKNNRLKLFLINCLFKNKKITWADELFKSIDDRKLSKSECRDLLEFKTTALTKCPDREINSFLHDSLRQLINSCREELKLNQGNLKDLYQYYISKQLLDEAINLCDILYKDDEYLYNVGYLHKIAHRLRWVSTNNYHLNLSKENFELLVSKYPESKLLPQATLYLIILDNINLGDTIKKLDNKIIPLSNSFNKDQIGDLLDILTPNAKEQIVIEYLKKWYTHLILNNLKTAFGEIILKFLREKSGLTLEEIAELLPRKNKYFVGFPQTLKNASVEQKIQFMVYWNTPWVPDADFSNLNTGFLFDETNNKPIFMVKNSPGSIASLQIKLAHIEKIPDYIYLELKSPEIKNLVEIEFYADYNKIYTEQIICSNEKKTLRIEIKSPLNEALFWQIKFKNPDKLNPSTIHISEPTFLYIQSVKDLDKKLKEKL